MITVLLIMACLIAILYDHAGWALVIVAGVALYGLILIAHGIWTAEPSPWEDEQ